RLKDKYPNIEINVISNKPPVSDEVEVQFIAWSKQTEIAALSKFDIGIMPLPDDDWARGKCGFKGLQYMSLGIPCVMSPVGANKDIVNDNENGFLADSQEEWFDKLSKLIEDPT